MSSDSYNCLFYLPLTNAPGTVDSVNCQPTCYPSPLDVSNLSPAPTLNGNSSCQGNYSEAQKPNKLEGSLIPLTANALPTSTQSQGVYPKDLKLQLAEYLLNLHPDVLGQMLQQSIPVPQPTAVNTSLNEIKSDGHTHQVVDKVQQYLLPIEANVTKDYPFSVQLLPRSDLIHETSAVAPQPFILPTLDTGGRRMSKLASKDNNCHSVDVSLLNLQKDEPSTHSAWQQSHLDHCTAELRSEQEKEIIESMTDHTHTGFIILSIRHEKIDTGSDLTEKLFRSPCIAPLSPKKSTKHYIPKQNGSKQQFTKSKFRQDPVALNSSRSNQKASEEPNYADTASSLASRFRVTRIADKNSWWIPDKASRAFIVHDLKTSSLPDFVIKQMQQYAALEKNIYENPDKCSTENIKEEFWKHLEPAYLKMACNECDVCSNYCKKSMTAVSTPFGKECV